MSSGSSASTGSSADLDAVEAGLEPVPEVRADVHDHGLGVESDATSQQAASATPDFSTTASSVPARLIRYEAWQTTGMSRTPRARAAEGREVLRRMHLCAPRARARREHLDRLAVERRAALDRRLDAAGRPDVSSDPHRAGAYRGTLRLKPVL